MCADHRGWTQSGRTCGLAKGKVVTTFKAKPFVADDTQTNPVISLHWLESTGTEPRVLPPTLPGFRALWVVPITLHPRLGPHFPLLDSLPPHFSLLRVVWLGTVLLTHKDGLAVHRGRVLVQGQGVCGQLPGLTALRLRGKDE